MKLRLRFFSAMITLAAATTAPAELKWEQTALELHPGISDATAVGHFKYENAGPKPVKILAVNTSCGCTAAVPTKNVVDPAEKGEITATFSIGDRIGTQHKSIMVQTDDPQQPSITLKLDTVIPALLDVQPAFLLWNVGEALTPKVITVKIGADFPVNNIKVESSDPEITATSAAAEGAKEFRITVSPKENTRQHMASLKIIPVFPPGAPKMYYASARVLSPPPVTASPAAEAVTPAK